MPNRKPKGSRPAISSPRSDAQAQPTLPPPTISVASGPASTPAGSTSIPPNEDRTINRRMIYATWAGVIVTIIAAASSFYFFLATQNAAKETLAITGIQRITIASTQIRPFTAPTNTRSITSTTGLLSANWRVFLSNNSDKDFSITKYRILQVPSQD